MFKTTIEENKIPPNFLNSLLTNPSLYEMFKDDFENNSEYFRGIEKIEYLGEMLKFIEDTLFSSNIFHIYIEPDDLESATIDKLSYIRRFYDDFLLEAFRENPEDILKTRIFKGLEFAKNRDLYASKTTEFQKLYDYIFKTSLDYLGIVEVLTKEPLAHLLSGETLSMKEFDILTNYVKNDIQNTIDMDLVMAFLHNHAYKTNHIFDRGLTEVLVRSTILSYLDEQNIPVAIEFHNGLDSKKESEHSFDPNIIRIDYSLIDGFISLNYVELFEHAFLEAEYIKMYTLLKENRCDYETLKTIMNLVANKVDLDRIFIDSDYTPTELYADLKASNFVKTLRFFSLFGVNLFSGYIASKTANLEIEVDEELTSKKEISLDQRFDCLFQKNPKRQEIVKKYSVMRLFYNQNGTKKKTIDLIKQLKNDSTKEAIIEYLHSRIIDPISMIDDVNELDSYKPKDPFIKDFIAQELKYIYVDTFYYSLDSYMKLYRPRLDLDEFLDDLLLKVNCIKDTPLTHRFIDEAIFTISDMKQSI